MNLILQGVVGSQAYGLATPDSDVDRLGIYAVDTAELFGLQQPAETRVTLKPDSTFHEARKFCALAVQCNPSVLELLWLGRYEVHTVLGMRLVTIRNHFLSARRVKSAYLGYATQQMQRLQQARAQFDDQRRPQKIAKHARHVARLAYQGYQLYRTATLPVKLPYPDLIRSIGDWAAQGDLEPLNRHLGSHEDKFNNNPSALPEAPDTKVIENWLHEVRMGYLPRWSRKPRLGNLLTDDLAKPVLGDAYPGDAVGQLGLNVK